MEKKTGTCLMRQDKTIAPGRIYSMFFLNIMMLYVMFLMFFLNIMMLYVMFFNVSDYYDAKCNVF